jgi:Domain of unknown function
MAQTAPQIMSPRSTNLSEANYHHHNQLQLKSPISPINQRIISSSPRVPTAIGPQMSPSTASTNKQLQDASQAELDDERIFFGEHRGWLMVIAILAAGSTYQAGLNPPGSFWESNGDGHVAGNPILSDMSSKRYLAFFYCNALSFVFSLVIIILLMNKHFYHELVRIRVLKMMMVLDLLSFIAAFATGSCRSIRSSIAIFVLVGVVFAFVAGFALYYSLLRNITYRARSHIKRTYHVREPEV